ncbi:MAG: hypothetical protein UDB11_07340 [Peptococcaceae bacterium]|nr:hypothetical protein [Peptococcaceae bacterium]
MDVGIACTVCTVGARQMQALSTMHHGGTQKGSAWRNIHFWIFG